MGHGVGVNDLTPPNTQGPTNCLMRYFGYSDFLRDASDRLELKRRWTSSLQPTVFCHNPAGTERNLGCFEQIQVTDLPPSPLAGSSSLLPIETPEPGLMRARQNSPHSASGDTATPVFLRIMEINLPRLEVGANLEWSPVLAGDPLRLTVQLSSPAWRQAALLQQAQNLTNELAPALLGVASNWVDGVRLNLYRVQTNGDRTLVLSEKSWPPFLRELASDAGLWDGLLAARSRERMAPSAAAALVDGAYALTVAWDGRGLVDAASLPVGGVVVGPDVVFNVQTAITDAQRAMQLRRLAFQEWDAGQDELARQHGLAALTLEPQNSSKESVETAFVVASANLRLQDYRGVAQSVQAMRDQFPEALPAELGEHALAYLRVLAPELQLVPPSATAPAKLTIIGLPNQTYALQFSSDLRSWTTLRVLTATTNRLEVLDSNAPANGNSYYRVLWLSQP
jgi:hypothetical protein